MDLNLYTPDEFSEQLNSKIKVIEMRNGDHAVFSGKALLRVSGWLSADAAFPGLMVLPILQESCKLSWFS